MPKKILLIILVLIILSGSALYFLFYYHKLPDLIILDYTVKKINIQGSYENYYEPQILIKNTGNRIADIRNIWITLGGSTGGRFRANKPFLLPNQTAILTSPVWINDMPNNSVISINTKHEYIKQIKESNYQNNDIIFKTTDIDKNNF